MTDWVEKKLEDLVEIDPEQISSAFDVENPFYYIDISAVSIGKIRFPIFPIYLKEAPLRARKILKDGDILMSTVRPNLKSFAKFKAPNRNSIFVASTGFAVLSKKEGTDLDYIYHFLFSNPLERQVDSLVVGSNYPAINTREVRELRILLPTCEGEQSCIAKILSTADEAITHTEAVIAKYQRIKTGLMQDLLTRGIDEQGNIRSKATHKFVVKNGIEAPEEWDVDIVGDVCNVTKLAGFEFTKYFDYSIGGEIIALRALNIKNEELDLSNIQTIPRRVSEQLVRSRINRGDVLITYIGAYIGDVLLINESDKYHLAPNIAKITPGKKIEPEFLEILLRVYLVQQQIRNLIATTATPSLTMGQIRNITLAYPKCLEEQKRIVNSIDSVKANIKAEIKHLSKLHALKNGLMQDLLSGQKRVNLENEN